ncbi:DUF6282 family protein [Halobacteriales archaeon Cl-PHB]
MSDDPDAAAVAPAEGDPGSLPADAIDVHVHTAPDLVERHATDVALARAAIDADMDGVLVKSHVLPTVGRVDLVNEAVGQEVLYGGVACNGSVGGLNPDAVETALELGARVVWLPTAWSHNHASQARAAGTERFVGQRVPGPDEDIRVAADGEVTPATREIVDLVAEYDATLGTGHVTPAEIDAVVDACVEAGVTPLVNHPFFRVVDLPVDRQVDLAERGAVMEYCAYAIGSTAGHSVERVAAAVERVGADNALLATDFGQADNPAVPGLAAFAAAVADAGVDRETVETLVTTTPRRVLGLDR